MNDGTVWEIAKWESVFEKAESRRHKTLNWISMPISFTSNGYQSLLDEFQTDAPAVYGAWCVLCAYAAQQPTRGRLATTQGRPIAWPTIARVTGFPVEVFTSLVAWATRPEVAWLIPMQPLEKADKTPENQRENDSPSDGPAFAQQSAGLPNQTRPNQTQPNQTSPDTPKGGRLADGFCFDEWKEVSNKLVRAGVSRWRQTIEAAVVAGCTPDMASQLIDFAVSKGVSAGALVCRLSNAHPSMAVDTGWPDRAEKSKKTSAKQASEDARKLRESEAAAIIREGRRLKKTDDDIQKDLTTKGLQWPK